MNVKRSVIVAHPDTSEAVETTHDTLPPSDARRVALDPDETAPLVSILHHVQQAVAASADALVSAFDANDEELARFFEDTQRESLARAEEAKRLLCARLHSETGDSHGGPAAPRQSQAVLTNADEDCESSSG